MVKTRKEKIIVLAVAALLAASVFFCVLSTGDSQIAEARDWQVGTGNAPLVAAHRSGRNVAPENTLLAFETCANATKIGDYKVDIFEFDVRMTADDKLILLHDDTLDRTTNVREVYAEKGHKKDFYPRDFTYEQLSVLNAAMDYKDADGNNPYEDLRGDSVLSNLKVPLLADVLSYLHEQVTSLGMDFSFIIEIKDGGELGKSATDQLYSLMVQYGFLSNTVVGTFHNEISEYFDTKAGLVRSAGMSEVAQFLRYYLNKTDLTGAKLGYKVLQIPKRFIVELPWLGTRGFIEYAHSFGLAVQYWTVNSEKDMSELAYYGADAIITDDPDVAFRVVNSETREYVDVSLELVLIAVIVVLVLLIFGIVCGVAEVVARGKARSAIEKFHKENG